MYYGLIGQNKEGTLLSIDSALLRWLSRKTR